MLNKVLIVISIFFVLSSYGYAAKRVPLSNADAANRLGLCVLSSDAEYRESTNYIACCSKSTGECIICPSSGRGSCISVAYSSNDPRLKNMLPAPPMSAGDFIAPVPASSSPRDKLERNAAPAYPAKNINPAKTTPTVKTHQKQESLKTNTPYK